MIPGIEEIVAGLLDGSIDRARAIAWLNTHVELAGDGGLRDSFAIAALAGLTNRATWADVRDGADECAAAAWAVADAMAKRA